MGIFRARSRTPAGPTPQPVSNSGIVGLIAGFFGGTPADAQIPIGQAGGSYAPKTVSGDATLADTGALTVTKVNGQTLGALATLNVGTGLAASGGNLNLQTATGSTLGGVKVDNVTITAASGVIGANGRQLPGTTTNDNASAGNVGEFVSSEVALGTTSALTSGAPQNLTSVPLAAGDWDVWGTVFFFGASTTTVTALSSSISTTSATISTSPLCADNTLNYAGTTPFAGAAATVPVGPVRLSLPSATTVYMVAKAVFGTSTAETFGGGIYARRRR